MSNTELLACLCGRTPKTGFNGDEDGGYGFVECPGPSNSLEGDGHFAGVHADDEEQAIAAWNALHTRAQLDELRAALVECEQTFSEVLDTLRREAPGTPLNNHKFTALGVRAGNALQQARKALGGTSHE